MLGNDNSDNNILDSRDIVDESLLEALGVERAVYVEMMFIVGHKPTIDEMSTFLAMWKSQGGKQSLLSWLKGQYHSAESHEYLENELEPESRLFAEPGVKDCIAIAHALFKTERISPDNHDDTSVHVGDAIYLVGDVSLFFTNSEYGRRYLHLVDNPVVIDGDDETAQYLELILGSLKANDALFGYRRVGRGGLFGTLVGMVGPWRMGFDILTCREVRLDAFLFGEQGVRFLTLLDEPREDYFLQKLTDARVNCCFLGRVTKDRVFVDNIDFGRSATYSSRK